MGSRDSLNKFSIYRSRIRRRCSACSNGRHVESAVFMACRAEGPQADFGALLFSTSVRHLELKQVKHTSPIESRIIVQEVLLYFGG